MFHFGATCGWNGRRGCSNNCLHQVFCRWCYTLGQFGSVENAILFAELMAQFHVPVFVNELDIVHEECTGKLLDFRFIGELVSGKESIAKIWQLVPSKPQCSVVGKNPRRVLCR